MKFNPQNGVHIPDYVGNSDDQALYHIRNNIVNYYKFANFNTPIYGLVHQLNKLLLTL
jgi:hypothetical protein